MERRCLHPRLPMRSESLPSPRRRLSQTLAGSFPTSLLPLSDLFDDDLTRRCVVSEHLQCRLENALVKVTLTGAADDAADLTAFERHRARRTDRLGCRGRRRDDQGGEAARLDLAREVADGAVTRFRTASRQHH